MPLQSFGCSEVDVEVEVEQEVAVEVVGLEEEQEKEVGLYNLEDGEEANAFSVWIMGEETKASTPVNAMPIMTWFTAMGKMILKRYFFFMFWIGGLCKDTIFIPQESFFFPVAFLLLLQ